MTNDNKTCLGVLSQLAFPPASGEVLCLWQGGDFSVDLICDDQFSLVWMTTKDPDLAVMIADRILIAAADGARIIQEIFIPRAWSRQRNDPRYRQLIQQLRWACAGDIRIAQTTAPKKSIAA